MSPTSRGLPRSGAKRRRSSGLPPRRPRAMRLSRPQRRRLSAAWCLAAKPSPRTSIIAHGISTEKRRSSAASTIRSCRATVPGLVPAREEVDAEAALIGRATKMASKSTRHSSRPRPVAPGSRRSSLSRDAAAAAGKRCSCRRIRLARPARFGAACSSRRARQGCPARHDQSGRFLNAEDDTTPSQTELVVDVAIVDRTNRDRQCAALRSRTRKYRGKRIYADQLLTHLYLAKFLFSGSRIRDLGYVRMLLRGVADPNSMPVDVNGRGLKKRDRRCRRVRHGGHCQALPCMDYVLPRPDASSHLAGPQGRNYPGLREFAYAVCRRSHCAPSRPASAG